jgi:hypothetical protein
LHPDSRLREAARAMAWRLNDLQQAGDSHVRFRTRPGIFSGSFGSYLQHVTSNPESRAMSKKTASLIIAAFAFAASASSAFAIDAKHTGRQTHREVPYNARASAAGGPSSEWTYGAREPFTAAQKRAFQTPTGAEVDRW